MIFYSVINNNKIVIRQLLRIRATVGCAGWRCSVWQRRKESTWDCGSRTSRRFIVKDQGQSVSGTLMIPADARERGSLICYRISIHRHSLAWNLMLEKVLNDTKFPLLPNCSFQVIHSPLLFVRQDIKWPQRVFLCQSIILIMIIIS